MKKDFGSIIIYKTQEGNNKIEVKVYENTVWLNQKQLSELFGVTKATVSEHIKNIFNEGELISESVVRNFRTTATDGKNYNIDFYNLDMILAIGYRVRSNIGINFRKWASETLKEYMVKGFAINDDILKESGGGRYFKELLARIRDIRSSERVFWRQVLDIFATSSDYDPKSEISINFFKTVQNKLHYAVHGHTAAEIIKNRADSSKDFMGMTAYTGDYPLLDDALIAKNYLDKKELEMLNRIVSLYLDFAELQALEENVMTMNDWVIQLDYFLKMSRKDILTGKGIISHQEALEYAKEEYKKFKDRLLVEPTDIERRYLDGLNVLLSYSKKNGE